MWYRWLFINKFTPSKHFGYLPLLGKLPKNHDPKVTPDPERWLPMRERSYYRGKKKGKKKEQIGKGTQGAMTGASAELWVASAIVTLPAEVRLYSHPLWTFPLCCRDASKTASSPPTSPRPGSASGSSTAPASNVVPPRQQKPAASGANRKKAPQKKKKGGKGGW